MLFAKLATAALMLGMASAGTATASGFSPERLDRIDAKVKDYVDSGQLAGAVVMVEQGGKVPYFRAIGWQDAEKKIPMQKDTIFRLASMTKPITAVAALILVEDGKIALDDPVDRWLPELANRKVLIDPTGPLDKTRPSPRAITLRDLLMYKMGLGGVPALDAARSPLSAAMRKIRLTSQDEFMKDLGTLPLAYAPGERWLYNTSSEVLGILISRVAGMPLDDFVAQRILRPLKMNDSGYHVPREKIGRLAKIYSTDPATGTIKPMESVFFLGADPTVKPVFPYGAGGMYSTAFDYDRFARMLLNKGSLDGVRILSPRAVEVMTTNHMTDGERKAAKFGLQADTFEERGFGYGVSVVNHVSRIGPGMGTFSWNGASGASWAADPSSDVVSIVLLQLMDFPKQDRIWNEVRTAIYAALQE
jgi:CubicO group peptidase (beta-lactamase class C family)